MKLRLQSDKHYTGHNAKVSNDLRDSAKVNVMIRALIEIRIVEQPAPLQIIVAQIININCYNRSCFPIDYSLVYGQA